jgi:CheY-like chemotaxis protein
MSRILVVEDDVLIAMDLEALLESVGCTVLGPVSSESAALELIEDGSPDLALLDINLNGGNAFGIADKLAVKKIPFAFLTGHSEKFVPAAHSERPVFSKPYQPRELGAGFATSYRRRFSSHIRYRFAKIR